MCHIQIGDGWAGDNKGLDAAISPQRDALSEDSHVVRAAKPRTQTGSGKLISMLQRAQLIGKHSSSLMAKPFAATYCMRAIKHTHRQTHTRAHSVKSCHLKSDKMFQKLFWQSG